MRNRIKLLIFLPLIMAAINVNGQDESLFNRINGIRFKEKIYLRWNDSKKLFLYSYDDINTWHTIDEDIIFQVKNHDKNNFKVLVEFYNPFRYSIKSEDKDLDDPAYQALTDFFSKLPAFPNTQTVEENKLKAAFSFTKDKTLIEVKQSILLHEWLYQLSQVLDPETREADFDGYKKLVNSINQLEKADNYLFGKINIVITSLPESATEGFTINDWIKKRSVALYDADNDFDKFKSEYDASVLVKEALKKSKDDAEKSLEVLVKLLSTDFDAKLSKFIKTDKLEDFKEYSTSTSVWLSMNNIDRFDANKKAIEKYETYLTKIDEHIKKFTIVKCDNNKTPNCFHYKEDYDVKLGWNVQKMKSFKYEVKKLDIDGSEIAKSNSTGEFVVGKKLSLYPFVSSGILYSGFSYPNYTVSTDDGINKVDQSSDTKVYIRPALFLNFLITSWDPAYPFLQLGVTTGVNDAIFPVGVGLSLGQSFSISLGAMLGYRKDLGSLSVGTTIKDETELKNDLVYKGFVSVYFSLNYNFGKK